MIHFKEKEFYCCPNCDLGFKDMDEEFIIDLDLARHEAGVPFILASAIRCEKHNKEVGGSVTSTHPKGLAVDIACRTSHERYQILHGLKKAGFTRFGVYVDKKFIHVDSDPDKPERLIWG